MKTMGVHVSKAYVLRIIVVIFLAWASAHRDKWGQLIPLEKWMKNKKAKTCKKSSFLCFCYILIAIRAGRCRERRYADTYLFR